MKLKGFRTTSMVVATLLAIFGLLATVPWVQGQSEGKTQEWLEQPFAEGTVATPSQDWLDTAVVTAGQSHYGQDWSVDCGTPLLALADGQVIEPSRAAYKLDPLGWGQALWVDVNLADGGVGYHYAHLSEILVQPGETVTQGQVIALSGGRQGEANSGFSTGCHVHLGVFDKHPDEFVEWYDHGPSGGWVNPWDYLGSVPAMETVVKATDEESVVIQSEQPFYSRISKTGWLFILGGFVLILLLIKKIRNLDPAEALVWVADHSAELKSANKRGCLSALKSIGVFAVVISAIAVWAVPTLRKLSLRSWTSAAKWLASSSEVENWKLLLAVAVVLLIFFWLAKRRKIGYPAPAGKSKKRSLLMGALVITALVIGVPKLIESVKSKSDSDPAPLFSNGEATYAMVYGGLGGWGTLGLAHTPEQAVEAAKVYAQKVDDWNGDLPVIPTVNINSDSVSDGELQQIIDLCSAGNCAVMIDVAGNRNIEAEIRQWTPIGEHVMFDIDVEHHGTPMTAGQINQAAELYFSLRREAGFESPSYFGFYDFRNPVWVQPVDEIRWEYPEGKVIVLYDGMGVYPIKVAGTDAVLDAYGAQERGYFGIMEFESRWQEQYDKGMNHQDYFLRFEPLFMIAQ